MSARLPVENADTVSLVCALLVRFPEIASIRSMPGERAVRLTFAVAHRLDKKAHAAIVESIEDHVHGFLLLARDEPIDLHVDCESDRVLSFVHVTRDLETFSKDELVLLVSLLAERFGATLVRTPTDASSADDLADQDEVAEYAIEALRDPAQSKTLVGFREDARVLVYFLKSRKKAKASSRR